jgi:abortive infection alpha-like protein
MLFASEEPDLREMYVKLLATSMDGATSDDAHPSFVTLIQQLTPDEARILHHLASLKQEWPYWTGDQESHELQSAMHQMCVDAGVADSTKADLYVENLLRLRILRHVAASESEYHPEGDTRFGPYEPSVSTKHSESIELTSYGRALLEACVVDNKATQQGDESVETRVAAES